MQQARTVPFREICDAAKPVLESICRRWLPQGHRSGAWWVANCPWRKDDKASLGVSLTTGHWIDFGAAQSGREKGDVINLFIAIYGGSKVEAAESVARLVGHEWRKACR
jgi:hypothetical protein